MRLIITCIALMLSPSSFSQLIGWNYDQVVKLKGTNYELKNTTTEGGTQIYFLKYYKKLNIDGPEMLGEYTETFVFRKSTNEVYSYLFLGSKKETDVVALIENNNNKYKVIDKGNKQENFEWHDEKSNTVFILNLMSNVGNEYKYIKYIAMGRE